jgi:hypothetical protein
MDGEEYADDVKLLWAAHSKKRFSFVEDHDQETFIKRLDSRMEIIEDRNPAFDGAGPVCLVTNRSDGWKVMPKAEFFPWASPRNILRCTVFYLQKLRYDKNTGVCVVYCLRDSLSLMNKAKEYGVLFASGKILGGQRAGDEYIFSIRGKRR